MSYLKKIKLIVVLLFLSMALYAHPMPHSVMLLNVKHNGIAAELQWPLKELHFVFPEERLDSNATTLLKRKGAWLDAYLLKHMNIKDSTGRPWEISILSKSVIADEQSYTGKYNELVFQLWLQPPQGVSPRHLSIYYDAIMHQLITHKMLIKIRQDWDGGLSEKDSADAELGTLMVHLADNTVPPIIINLDEGSKWKGFKSMVQLGIRHISEGTDHLLFLLVLMLPAPLIAAQGKWKRNGDTKYAIKRLLKIATAFTIGHSITLLAGAIGWFRLPGEPVEILIALSIIVGAIHAIRPLFPGKEIYVAAGFGLIHGLAFAATLATLDVDSERMAISILGFNVGIELMQLFVIILFVPWFIMLCRYPSYNWIRTIGAVFALIASVGWIVERITQHSNIVGTSVQSIATHGQWVVLLLAIEALSTYWRPRKKISV